MQVTQKTRCGSPSGYLGWNAAPDGPDGKHIPPVSAPLPSSRLLVLAFFHAAAALVPHPHTHTLSTFTHLSRLPLSLPFAFTRLQPPHPPPESHTHTHLPFPCFHGMFAFLNSLGHAVLEGRHARKAALHMMCVCACVCVWKGVGGLFSSPFFNVKASDIVSQLFGYF